jgi:hypothetical protein
MLRGPRLHPDVPRTASRITIAPLGSFGWNRLRRSGIALSSGPFKQPNSKMVRALLDALLSG